MIQPLHRLVLPLLTLAFLGPREGVCDEGSFSSWLDDLRADARTSGVSAATLEATLENVVPIDRVLQLQERQPESRLSWAEYRRRVVSEDRVVRGRGHMEQDDELLHSVAAQYGVQPRFLVALWGVESDFGHHTGDTPAVAALATLGWGGRRGDYFRRELIALLTTVELGYVDPAALYGSWAGALGQCQFMPSNFKRFAVDYDGDGMLDLLVTGTSSIQLWHNEGERNFSERASQIGLQPPARYPGGSSWGDYDGDGMTSTSILVRCIRLLRGNITFFVPNRLSDGYGLNNAAVERFLHGFKDDAHAAAPQLPRIPGAVLLQVWPNFFTRLTTPTGSASILHGGRSMKSRKIIFT